MSAPDAPSASKSSTALVLPLPLLDVARFFRAAQAGILIYWTLFALELFLAASITAMALWGLADLLAGLTPETHRWIRGVYFCMGILTAAGLLMLVIRQARRRSALATWMEDRERAFEGNLLASAEALDDPARVPPAVAAIAAERALEVLREVGARPIHPRLPWNKAHLWLLSAMSITLVAALIFGPAFFQAFVRGLFPAGAAEAVLAIRFLEISPGEADAIEGDALPVEALVSGSRAGALYVQLREAEEAEGPAPVEHALYPVSAGQTEDRWRGSLGVVRKNSLYRLVAYAAAELGVQHLPHAYCTDWYPVNVRPRSGLRDVSVWVEAPGYTGFRPFGRSNPASVQALAQSEITVLLTASPAGDLGAGYAQLPGGKPAALERLFEKDGLAYYRTRFPAERSGVLRLNLEPVDVKRGAVRTSLTISVVQDLTPEADAVIPSQALPEPDGLPVDVRIFDDIGLTSARLVLKPLPPEEGREAPEFVRELSYEIPLPAKNRRELNERWMLPVRGLEAWLAAGFQYQVEATDGASPRSQTGRSPLRRWDPKRPGRPQSEQAGLMESSTKRPARSLTRPNALGKIPDPTPDELARMGDPGAGVRPKQLQRPQMERLGSGGQPSGNSGSGTGAPPSPGGKDPSATTSKKPQDGYDRAQGLPKGEKSSAPDPSGQRDPQGEKPGGTVGEKQPEAGADKTPPDGGKTAATGAGRGKTPKRGEGGASGSSEGKDAEGERTDENRTSPGNGSEGSGEHSSSGNEDAGENQETQAGGSGTGSKGGAGGQTPRDGGPKTGREVGTGSGRTSPPDLQTLARMKGITLEEARNYLAQKGIGTVRTDYGTTGAKANSPVQQSNDSARLFALATPEVSKKVPLGSKLASSEHAPGARLVGVDPIYLPIVEGYFRRMVTSAGATKPDRK